MNLFLIQCFLGRLLNMFGRIKIGLSDIQVNNLFSHLFPADQPALGLNRGPADYESAALPLSYAGFFGRIVENGCFFMYHFLE